MSFLDNDNNNNNNTYEPNEWWWDLRMDFSADSQERFFTNCIEFLAVQDHWFCTPQLAPYATELLRLFSNPISSRMPRKLLTKQLSSCASCVIGYHEACDALKQRLYHEFDEKSVDVLVQALDKFDEDRICETMQNLDSSYFCKNEPRTFDKNHIISLLDGDDDGYKEDGIVGSIGDEDSNNNNNNNNADAGDVLVCTVFEVLSFPKFIESKLINPLLVKLLLQVQERDDELKFQEGHRLPGIYFLAIHKEAGIRYWAQNTLKDVGVIRSLDEFHRISDVFAICHELLEYETALFSGARPESLAQQPWHHYVTNKPTPSLNFLLSHISDEVFEKGFLSDFEHLAIKLIEHNVQTLSVLYKVAINFQGDKTITQAQEQQRVYVLSENLWTRIKEMPFRLSANVQAALFRSYQEIAMMGLQSLDYLLARQPRDQQPQKYLLLKMEQCVRLFNKFHEYFGDFLDKFVRDLPPMSKATKQFTTAANLFMEFLFPLLCSSNKRIRDAAGNFLKKYFATPTKFGALATVSQQVPDFMRGVRSMISFVNKFGAIICCNSLPEMLFCLEKIYANPSTQDKLSDVIAIENWWNMACNVIENAHVLKILFESQPAAYSMLLVRSFDFIKFSWNIKSISSHVILSHHSWLPHFLKVDTVSFLDAASKMRYVDFVAMFLTGIKQKYRVSLNDQEKALIEALLDSDVLSEEQKKRLGSLVPEIHSRQNPSLVTSKKSTTPSSPRPSGGTNRSGIMVLGSRNNAQQAIDLDKDTEVAAEGSSFTFTPRNHAPALAALPLPARAQLPAPVTTENKQLPQVATMPSSAPALAPTPTPIPKPAQNSDVYNINFLFRQAQRANDIQDEKDLASPSPTQPSASSAERPASANDRSRRVPKPPTEPRQPKFLMGDDEMAEYGKSLSALRDQRKRQVMSLDVDYNNPIAEARRKQLAANNRLADMRREREEASNTFFQFILALSPETLLEKSAATQIFSRIPDVFDGRDHYANVFKPFIFSECKAQIQRALEEQDNEKEKVILSQFRKENDYSVFTFQFAEKRLPGLNYTNTDIILLETDQQHQQQDKLTLLGRYVVSPEKNSFDIMCYVPQGSANSERVRKNVITNSRWVIMKLFTISTVFKEFMAVNTLSHMPQSLAQWVINPKRQMEQEKGERDFMMMRTALTQYQQQEALKKMNGITPNVAAYITRAFNPSQVDAILCAANRKHGFTLIQGPPGTGKTHTIAGLISVLLTNNARAVESSEHNHKVLVCAPSNAAIDELIVRIRKHGLLNKDMTTYQPRIVRIGVQDRMHPTVKEVYIDTLVDEELERRKKENLENLNAEMSLVEEEWNSIQKERSEASAELAKFVSIPENIRTSVESLSIDKYEARLRSLAKQEEKNTEKRKQLQDAHELFTKELPKLKKEIQQTIMQQAEIVCTTLGSAGNHPYSLRFNTIIIDEACQAVEPSALVPLVFYNSERCILVGDPQQLPATVISKACSDWDYDQSLYSRLLKCGHPKIMLLVQYRMHPEIRLFPSKHFYDSKLTDGRDCAQNGKELHSLAADGCLGPYVFYDCVSGRSGSSARSNSLKNNQEASLIVDLYDMLSACYPPTMQLDGNIAVVTPYKLQSIELRNQLVRKYGQTILSKIEVNTVDGFQGREKDIIIISCVRSHADEEIGLGFVSDIRRMNVALTRARNSLFVIGNSQTLCQNSHWRALIEDAKERRCYFRVDDSYEFFRRIKANIAPIVKKMPRAPQPPSPLPLPPSTPPQAPKATSFQDSVPQPRAAQHSSSTTTTSARPDQKRAANDDGQVMNGSTDGTKKRRLEEDIRPSSNRSSSALANAKSTTTTSSSSLSSSSASAQQNGNKREIVVLEDNFRKPSSSSSSSAATTTTTTPTPTRSTSSTIPSTNAPSEKQATTTTTTTDEPSAANSNNKPHIYPRGRMVAAADERRESAATSTTTTTAGSSNSSSNSNYHHAERRGSGYDSGSRRYERDRRRTMEDEREHYDRREQERERERERDRDRHRERERERERDRGRSSSSSSSSYGSNHNYSSSSSSRDRRRERSEREDEEERSMRSQLDRTKIPRKS